MLTLRFSSDELNQVDDQIAAYAQEHIHSNEVGDYTISSHRQFHGLRLAHSISGIQSFNPTSKY